MGYDAGRLQPAPNREQRRDAQRETGGFKPDRKRYRLKFETPELAGFEVTFRGLVIDTFLELAELADMAEPGRKFSAEDAAKMRRMFEIVADGLVEWNLLDDDDQPVPATLAGVLSQEYDLVLAVAEGWMKAVGSVPAPLARPSTDGRPSAVASLPMEPRSGSQAL